MGTLSARGRSPAWFIEALRNGAETLKEVSEMTGRSYRSAIRTMQLLLKSRRIRAWKVEVSETGNDGAGGGEEWRFRLYG